MNLICLMVLHGGERPLFSCFSIFVVSRPFKLGKKIDTSFLKCLAFVYSILFEVPLFLHFSMVNRHIKTHFQVVA